MNTGGLPLKNPKELSKQTRPPQRELGITRARVSQIMGLLKLPEEIQRVLLELNDQGAIHYFSERRLRPLNMIPDPEGQAQEFNRMLEDICSPVRSS